MTDTTALRAIAERASVLMSGTKSNIPRNDLPGRKRLVGFLVPEEVAGLSTGLFLLDAVQDAVNALPALLDHIDAQARAREEAAEFKASTAYRHSLIGRMEERALKAEAALEEARAALEPFAQENILLSDHVGDWFGPSNFRRARAASQSLARQEGVEG